jgi:Fe-Mn family superoxide dismutase
MKNSTQNRRQFLSKTGKAGIALATMPLITKIFPSHPTYMGTDFIQQPLPYAYNALEPFIDAMTMEIHYTKHAATYAKNLSDACVAEKVETTKTDLKEVLKSISKYSSKMRNNAGGHYNHELFWQIMKPSPSTGPTGPLAEGINKAFGSYADFQKVFGEAAKTRFGSGWAWLLVKADGTLAVSSTPNQDNPLMDVAELQGTPLLGLDVWEHAYYLKYQNKRPDYINAWWNIVNWEFVQNRYTAEQAQR